MSGRNEPRESSVVTGTVEEAMETVFGGWDQRFHDALCHRERAEHYDRLVIGTCIVGIVIGLVGTLLALAVLWWFGIVALVGMFGCLLFAGWLHSYRWAPAANESRKLMGSHVRFREDRQHEG